MDGSSRNCGVNMKICLQQSLCHWATTGISTIRDIQCITILGCHGLLRSIGLWPSWKCTACEIRNYNRKISQFFLVSRSVCHLPKLGWQLKQWCTDSTKQIFAPDCMSGARFSQTPTTKFMASVALPRLNPKISIVWMTLPVSALLLPWLSCL